MTRASHGSIYPWDIPRGRADTEQDVARCYCGDCGPDGIAAPTLGTSETLAAAALGTVSEVRRQTHRFSLLKVDPVATSPVAEGTPP
ncbi:hypothetical protein G9464_02745 [Halostella sp. JP-L12]|uniref:hypothetical protein n=1 Tax=Halostella TaxID=1843185 RepID=UPI0013CE7F0B|nr:MULTISPECIES: hypothetical protein [Halostella]NHN46515.1 hypothetical protein [Halostella sp. JP-L12]